MEVSIQREPGGGSGPWNRDSNTCSHSAFLSLMCLINCFLGLLWPVEGMVFGSGPGWRIVHLWRQHSRIKLLPAAFGAGGTRHTLIPPTSWPQKACCSLPGRPGSWLSLNPPLLPLSSGRLSQCPGWAWDLSSLAPLTLTLWANATAQTRNKSSQCKLKTNYL